MRPGMNDRNDPVLWEASRRDCVLIDQRRMPGALIPLLTSAIVSVTGLSPMVAGLLTSIATTAIVMGIQMALAPDVPKPADGKTPKQQAIPPCAFGYGRVRTAGAYMLWEEADQYLYGVIALFAHPCHQLVQVYLNDDAVTIGGDSFVDEMPDGRYRGDNIWIQTRMGATPETVYAPHVAALGGTGLWTASHRGDGQTSLGFECGPTGEENFQKTYPYNAPTPSAVIDTAKVFNISDPGQAYNNPATWTYSRNSALCLIHWLCFNRFGPQWPYTQAILPNLARWQQEQALCDLAVPLGYTAGTEPQYCVDGWATTETDPIAVLNQLLASCDGHLAQYGNGSLMLTVGYFRTELVEHIYEEDIVGYYIQHDVPEEDEINRIVPRFTNPATGYTADVTDYFEDTTMQAKAGRILSQDATLEWVTSWTQARRLAHREWLRLLQKKSGTLDLRLSAINAVRARWIQLHTPNMLPSLNGTIIENRRSIMALAQGGFQMEWKKHP